MKPTDFPAPQISTAQCYKKSQKTNFILKKLKTVTSGWYKSAFRLRTFTDDSRADLRECNLLLFVYDKVNYSKVKHIGKPHQRSSFEKQLINI